MCSLPSDNRIILRTRIMSRRTLHCEFVLDFMLRERPTKQLLCLTRSLAKSIEIHRVADYADYAMHVCEGD
jgi:hypothetical protein